VTAVRLGRASGRHRDTSRPVRGITGRTFRPDTRRLLRELPHRERQRHRHHPRTHAWRSLGNLTRAFSGSTALYLARDCSWQGGIWLSGNGTASAPIVLDAYGTGAAPHVANAGGGASSSAITLAGSHQIVQNLLITDGRAAGSELQGANSIVRNSEISSSGVGVQTAQSTPHARLLGNYVHDLHMVVNTPKSVHPRSKGSTAGSRNRTNRTYSR
jgi:hypothetical protein